MNRLYHHEFDIKQHNVNYHPDSQTENYMLNVGASNPASKRILIYQLHELSEYFIHSSHFPYGTTVSYQGETMNIYFLVRRMILILEPLLTASFKQTQKLHVCRVIPHFCFAHPTSYTCIISLIF